MPGAGIENFLFGSKNPLYVVYESRMKSCARRCTKVVKFATCSNNIGCSRSSRHGPGVPPENRVVRRNRGFSGRDWIPSSACTRPPFLSSFQHSATASVGAQPSSLSSLLFGISSVR